MQVASIRVLRATHSHMAIEASPLAPLGFVCPHPVEGTQYQHKARLGNEAAGGDVGAHNLGISWCPGQC